MAYFQYRAADSQGKVVEGTIEAAEAAAVVARLQDRGLIPIRIGAAVGDAKAKGAAATSTGAPSRLSSLSNVSFITRRARPAAIS